MEHKDAAKKLAELGHETRLAIYRHLVKSGTTGLAVSELQKELDIPASTLSHHINRLIQAGLMQQHREGRVLRCVACFPELDALMSYLVEECCTTGICKAC